MHELSIATNIVEIAEVNVKKNNGKSVSEIEIEIGNLSGVVQEALDFAMDVAFENTVLENAKIKIIKIQAKAKCKNCLHEFEVQDFFSPCPKCNSFNPEILQGKELKVKSLVID
ncbi:MAG: hydrogenase maturation nickel metallochaperone HypA [Bacteroidota bacterium]|nr:hydrogenase maturation nickel metallochaperone HypA [Bacteroidota bacterium]